MTVGTHRRRLLKLAASIPVSMPVLGLAKSSDQDLFSYYPLKNREMPAKISAGRVVIVDDSIGVFSGDGFYLYPDWGSPVVYEVKRQGSILSFYFPGHDKSLWQMNAANDGARFSGRVEGILDEGDARDELFSTVHELRLLKVPDLPA